MKTKKIAAGDFLYHPVHGMCRIDRMIQQNQSGKKTTSYSLVPKVPNRMKVRFVIADADIEASGFHGLVSIKEANSILNYLKAGNGREEQIQPTWMLAQAILSFCAENFPAREQRKRQTLDYSVRGLTGELACVFKITLKEASDMIKGSLGKQHLKNSSLIAALASAGED